MGQGVLTNINIWHKIGCGPCIFNYSCVSWVLVRLLLSYDKRDSQMVTR